MFEDLILEKDNRIRCPQCNSVKVEHKGVVPLAFDDSGQISEVSHVYRCGNCYTRFLSEEIEYV